MIGFFIYEEQSTFFYGRQILESILVANKLVDEAQNVKRRINSF